MKQGVLLYTLTVIQSVCLFSCTVKEDRTPCPCHLSVDVTEALPSGTSFEPKNSSVFYISMYDESSDMTARECFDRHTMGKTVEFDVAKGYVYLVAMMGLENSSLIGNEVVIPAGYEADEIYLSSDMVDCLEETSFTDLKMKKQFSRISLKDNSPDSLLSRYKLVITSSSAGMDILSYSPLMGEFRFSPKRLDDGTYSFKIPRQRDKNIVVRLLDVDSKEVDSIPLGKYLDEYGYDWDASSLEDVSISINMAETGISVSVKEWNGSIEFDEWL